ncbi:MAG: FAD:protein FMN transferase [Kiritimatiellae bacterium]|nr:FAD:protein FMN transferase [Kiritimatiellia bacterium]
MGGWASALSVCRLGLPFLGAIWLLLPAGCRPAPAVESHWPVMSTVAALKLPAERVSELAARRDLVADTFATVESQMSLFRADSDLARLNAAAGRSAVELGEATAEVVDYALRVARESGGAFDPTVGPLMRLWGFGGGAVPAGPPDAAAVAEVRERIGWTNVWLEPLGTGTFSSGVRRAHVRLAGARLDLGGIAKGYAVDLAHERLRQAGCADFLIDLAGNMRAHGRPASRRRDWRVGVRNPFETTANVGVLTLRDGEALATSGNYERFVTIGGRRYAHIMDPRTGQPATGLVSVTVLAGSAMEADALSTALFVLGPEEGRALLAQHPGCEALFITDATPPRILLTPGAVSRFSPHAAWKHATLSRPNAEG